MLLANGIFVPLIYSQGWKLHTCAYFGVKVPKFFGCTSKSCPRLVPLSVLCPMYVYALVMYVYVYVCLCLCLCHMPSWCADNTKPLCNGPFNPLVLKAHNSVCKNLLFPLQIKSVKASLRFIIYYLRIIYFLFRFLQI